MFHHGSSTPIMANNRFPDRVSYFSTPVLFGDSPTIVATGRGVLYLGGDGFAYVNGGIRPHS